MSSDNLARGYDDAIAIMADQRREIEILRADRDNLQLAASHLWEQLSSSNARLVAANKLLQRWKNRTNYNRATELWTETTEHLIACKRMTEGGQKEKAND